RGCRGRRSGYAQPLRPRRDRPLGAKDRRLHGRRGGVPDARRRRRDRRDADGESLRRARSALSSSRDPGRPDPDGTPPRRRARTARRRHRAGRARAGAEVACSAHRGGIMSTEIRMPRLGHSMTEGTLVAWLAKPGDPVHAGQIVLTIETDKAEYEVEAPVDGLLAE